MPQTLKDQGRLEGGVIGKVMRSEQTRDHIGLRLDVLRGKTKIMVEFTSVIFEVEVVHQA